MIFRSFSISMVFLSSCLTFLGCRSSTHLLQTVYSSPDEAGIVQLQSPLSNESAKVERDGKTFDRTVRYSPTNIQAFENRYAFGEISKYQSEYDEHGNGSGGTVDDYESSTYVWDIKTGQIIHELPPRLAPVTIGKVQYWANWNVAQPKDPQPNIGSFDALVFRFDLFKFTGIDQAPTPDTKPLYKAQYRISDVCSSNEISLMIARENDKIVGVVPTKTTTFAVSADGIGSLRLCHWNAEAKRLIVVHNVNNRLQATMIQGERRQTIPIAGGDGYEAFLLPRAGILMNCESSSNGESNRCFVYRLTADFSAMLSPTIIVHEGSQDPSVHFGPFSMPSWPERDATMMSIYGNGSARHGIHALFNGLGENYNFLDGNMYISKESEDKTVLYDLDYFEAKAFPDPVDVEQLWRQFPNEFLAYRYFYKRPQALHKFVERMITQGPRLEFEQFDLEGELPNFASESYTTRKLAKTRLENHIRSYPNALRLLPQLREHYQQQMRKPGHQQDAELIATLRYYIQSIRDGLSELNQSTDRQSEFAVSQLLAHINTPEAWAAIRRIASADTAPARAKFEALRILEFNGMTSK